MKYISESELCELETLAVSLAKAVDKLNRDLLILREKSDINPPRKNE